MYINITHQIIRFLHAMINVRRTIKKYFEIKRKGVILYYR